MENPVQIKVYDQPTHFLAAVEPTLSKQQAMNSLMLGLSQGFASGSLAEAKAKGCLRLAAAWRGKDFVAATMLSSPNDQVGNFIVTEAADPEAINALASDLQDAIAQDKLLFTGVVGEEATVSRYGQYFEANGYENMGVMGQGIYRCRQVIMPLANDELNVRLATPADRDIIGKWLKAFILEAVPQDLGDRSESEALAHCLAIADAKIARGQQWLAERGGEPLTMAATTRELGKTISVNGVYTPPEHRCRGYGSLVTAVVTDTLLAAGKDEVHLYTDLANPTSNKIYQNIGYEFVGNSRHVLLKPS